MNCFNICASQVRKCDIAYVKARWYLLVRPEVSRLTKIAY
jgi:hypothetical protein